MCICAVEDTVENQVDLSSVHHSAHLPNCQILSAIKQLYQTIIIIMLQQMHGDSCYYFKLHVLLGNI